MSSPEPLSDEWFSAMDDEHGCMSHSTEPVLREVAAAALRYVAHGYAMGTDDRAEILAKADELEDK